MIGFPYRDLAAAEGVVFPDHFVYYTGVGGRRAIERTLFELRPGVTEVYLHPAVDTDELRASHPDWAGRVEDHAWLCNDRRSPASSSRAGATLIGYRELRELQRAALSPAGSGGARPRTRPARRALRACDARRAAHRRRSRGVLLRARGRGRGHRRRRDRVPDPRLRRREGGLDHARWRSRPSTSGPGSGRRSSRTGRPRSGRRRRPSCTPATSRRATSGPVSTSRTPPRSRSSSRWASRPTTTASTCGCRRRTAPRHRRAWSSSARRATGAIELARREFPDWEDEVARGIERGTTFAARDAAGETIAFGAHSVNRHTWIGPMATDPARATAAPATRSSPRSRPTSASGSASTTPRSRGSRPCRSTPRPARSRTARSGCTASGSEATPRAPS